MPSPPSPVSILFRFWFLLHSLLEGRKNSTRHPSTLRPYRPENLSIVRKENRNIHSENTILEESTKWLDGKRVGRIVESRAMCRGELGDLTKLAPRTPNDLFLSVSHHCTLTPARPQSRIKYSRWTQFACKERSFQGTETAPPTYHFESKREQLGESLFRNRSPVSYRIRTKGIGKILHSPRYRSTAFKAFPLPQFLK